MNDTTTVDAYGVLTDPTTLTIQRLLPGPIERVWSYLTDSDLRRQWFAAGKMEMKVGAPFELVWRNDELSAKPSKQPRPADKGEESRMQSTITELNPPHKLAFTFGDYGNVSMELETKGAKVLLTLIHRRIPNRSVLLGVSSGWHMHLDVLVASLNGEKAEPFWDGWRRLKDEYDQRLPA